MISNTNQLNKRQLNDLEKLKASCKKIDGSVPNLYTYLLAQRRSLPASLLYYEKNHLLGFLGVYFFYDDAVEVALLIDPSARRRGIAKKLLQDILPLIQTNKFKKIIFSSPEHLNNQWLLALGFSYLHCEYYMKRDDLKPMLGYNQSLVFRTAKADDIPILCALDEVCFPKKQTELTERFQHLLDDRNYQIFIASQNNQIVGKAHIRWEANEAALSDIAVIPALQGKGFGTALIVHCINHALSEGIHHLCLDVETHNQRALSLYTKLGFLIENACDYWSINTDQLHYSLNQ